MADLRTALIMAGFVVPKREKAYFLFDKKYIRGCINLATWNDGDPEVPGYVVVTAETRYEIRKAKRRGKNYS